jgi:exonuclease III
MLVGDLNITPESGLLEPFAAGGWIDVWSDLRPREDGFTFLEDGRLAKRIDYVWVNRELRPHVEGIGIVADSKHETGAKASDHVGLQVSVAIMES